MHASMREEVSSKGLFADFLLAFFSTMHTCTIALFAFQIERPGPERARHKKRRLAIAYVFAGHRRTRVDMYVMYELLCAHKVRWTRTAGLVELSIDREVNKRSPSRLPD